MTWQQAIGASPSNLIKGDGFSVRLYSRYGVRYCEQGRELTLATDYEDATDRYGRTLLVFPTYETQLYIPTALKWDDGEPISNVDSPMVLERIKAICERYMRPYRVIVGDEMYEKLAASAQRARDRAEGRG